MPTIFTHVAVPLAIGLGAGSKVIPRRLLLCGMLAAILPDCDVVAFKLGIALLWPWSHQRWFFPWQVIEVSPIGVRHLFSPRSLAVIRSELFWVWLPALFLGSFGWALRRLRNARSPDSN